MTWPNLTIFLLILSSLTLPGVHRLLIHIWRNIHLKKKTTKTITSAGFIKWTGRALTFYLLNFLNVIIHLPFLKLSSILFRSIKMKTWNWSANSTDPGQTVHMAVQVDLTLYWWQKLITFGFGRIRVKLALNCWVGV